MPVFKDAKGNLNPKNIYTKAEVDALLLGNIVSVPLTKVAYVDGGRTDIYTPNGSSEKPFKTIAAATVWATGKPETVIVVCPGTYAENVVLPNSVSLAGMGYVRIQGSLTTGTTDNTLSNLGVYGNVTINGMSFIHKMFTTHPMVINDDCQAFGLSVKLLASSAPALTVNCASGQTVTISDGALNTLGSFSSVVHNGGMLVLNNLEINNSDAIKPTIKSTGGALITQLCFVVNAGGGAAIDCQNGSVGNPPNMLTDTLVAGNVVCGTAASIVSGVYGTGTATGAAILSPITGSH